MRRRPAPFAFLRLQLRLWSAGLRQWLLSLGLMPDRDAPALAYAYAFYVAALGLLWVGTSWGALVSLTLQAAGALPQSARGAIAAAVPGLFPLALVALAVAALLGMPLRLSGADVAHLTGASVPRRLLAALRFLPSALAVAAIALPVGTVLAVLATDAASHYLAATAAMLPLAVGAYAFYWALGLLRLATARTAPRALLWLVPVATLLLLLFRSPLLAWPGQTFIRLAVTGTVQLSGLIAWLLAGLLCMLAAAGALRRPLLADESLRRNLLRSIDAGRRWNPAIAAQQRRAAILSRRRPYLALPRVGGAGLLAARGALCRLRYPPSLWGLVRAAAILLGGLDLAILPLRGAGWVMWLLIVMLYQPTALTEEFQMDEDPLWRQFIAFGSPRLLLYDALVPGAVVLLAGIVDVFLLHLPLAGAASALLLLLALLAVATLAQAVAAAAGPARRLPLPDILPQVVGYGLFALFGILLHAALVAAVVLFAYAAVLARLLEGRKSSAARAWPGRADGSGPS